MELLIIRFWFCFFKNWQKITKSYRCCWIQKWVTVSGEKRRWTESYRSTGPAEPPGSADSGCPFGPAAAAGVRAGNTVTQRAAALPGCTGSRDRAAETRLETRSLPGPRTLAGPTRIPPQNLSRHRAAAWLEGQTLDPVGPWWRSLWFGTQSREGETCQSRSPETTSWLWVSPRSGPPEPSWFCHWGRGWGDDDDDDEDAQTWIFRGTFHLSGPGLPAVLAGANQQWDVSRGRGLTSSRPGD